MTLQGACASTANTYGESTATWSDVVRDIPAEIQTLGVTEGQKGEIVKGEATIQVKMRYRSGITQLQRFKCGARYLYIQEVASDVRNRELTCTCRETLT